MDLSQKTEELRLTTPRLVLRNMTRGDAADLVAIVTVPETGRMLFKFPPDWTVRAAEDFIETTRFKGRWPFRLGVYLQDRLIGSVGVGQGEAPDVYYFLATDAQGNGYGLEAMRGLLLFLFKELGREAVVADVFDDNPGSKHILTQLGFVETGTGFGTSAARLEPAPITLYRLSRNAFVGQP